MRHFGFIFVFLASCAVCYANEGAGLVDVRLFFYIAFFVYALWVIISVVIARKTSQSGTGRTLIVVALACAPLAYCQLEKIQSQSSIDEQAARNKQLTLVADSYLAEKCNKERQQLSVHPVVPSGGVLIQVEFGQKLYFPNGPSPKQEADKMLAGKRHYGESYPLEMHKLQYESPALWADGMRRGTVLSRSQFSFVEENDPYYYGEKWNVFAQKSWWLETGLALVTPEEKEKMTARLVDMPDTKNDYMSSLISSSKARYVVSVRDVSTLEDRNHWVARARIRLIEKESGSVMAEYLGFAANQYPAYTTAGYSASWNKTKVCPGKEQNYLRNGDLLDWDVAGFFFGEVVTYE